MANTANYGWVKPNVGGDGDAWGGEINNDLDAIDNVVHRIDVSDAAKPPDAPSDGTSYARRNGAWNGVLPLSGGVVSGGTAFTAGIILTDPTRLSLGGGNVGQVLTKTGVAGQTGWADPAASGIPDAPSDGNAYLRSNGVWTSSGTITGSLTVTGALAGSNGAFSGSLSIGSGWTTANLSNGGLSVNLADGGNTPFLIQAARAPSGGVRWTWQMPDGTAETGGNAGSNFVLTPYGDNGAARSPALSIARATSLATVAGDPTANLGVATKQYVDAKAGGAFLPLSGGTLSGGLNIAGLLPSSSFGLVIAPPTTSGGIALNASAPNFGNGVAGQVTGNLRWWLALGDQSIESGGNAGCNFALWNYTDAGARIATPLAINRATGVTTLSGLSAPQAIGDNRIINGDCRIDQRNNGVSGTAPGYTIDRWQYSGSQPSKGTWQRALVSAPGFPYAWKFISSSAYTLAAGDFFIFYQSIEADMISDFAWGTVNAQPATLSFWVFSGLTGLLGGSLRNNSSTRSYPFIYSVPTANTWTKVVVPILGDTLVSGTNWPLSGNGLGLQVMFSLGCGVNLAGSPGAWASANYLGATGAVSFVSTNAAEFDVTGVKLEIGNAATPYNRQSMAKSLADCQRYFQTCNISYLANTSASTTYGGLYAFQTAMRAVPTAALISGANIGAGGFPARSVVAISNNSVLWGGVPTTAGAGTGFNDVISVSAEL